MGRLLLTGGAHSLRRCSESLDCFHRRKHHCLQSAELRQWMSRLLNSPYYLLRHWALFFLPRLRLWLLLSGVRLSICFPLTFSSAGRGVLLIICRLTSP